MKCMCELIEFSIKHVPLENYIRDSCGFLVVAFYFSVSVQMLHMKYGTLI